MTDDDLRARLRDADPALSLTPVSPDRVARLLGETMTTDVVVTARTPRRRLLVAAVLVLIVAAAGGGWLALRDGNRPGPATVATPLLVTRLTGATGVQAKCAEPTPERLAEAADFAFAGTVTGIDGGVVTLTVSHVYRGGRTGRVEVAQAGTSSEQMLGSGTFETGRAYLVASSAGTVLICGYSGEADSIGLAELYTRAF